MAIPLEFHVPGEYKNALPKELLIAKSRVLKKSTLAGVAELADAHDSGSCALTGVEVQVLSPALWEARKTVVFYGLFS